MCLRVRVHEVIKSEPKLWESEAKRLMFGFGRVITTLDSKRDINANTFLLFLVIPLPFIVVMITDSIDLLFKHVFKLIRISLIN